MIARILFTEGSHNKTGITRPADDKLIHSDLHISLTVVSAIANICTKINREPMILADPIFSAENLYIGVIMSGTMV